MNQNHFQVRLVARRDQDPQASHILSLAHCNHLDLNPSPLNSNLVQLETRNDLVGTKLQYRLLCRYSTASFEFLT